MIKAALLYILGGFLVFFDGVFRHINGIGISFVPILAFDAEVELKKIVELQTKQAQAWEEHKKTHDELLAKKANNESIADLQEKLDKINADLKSQTDQLVELAKKSKPTFANGEKSEWSEDDVAYKSGMMEYVKKGSDSGLRELEKKVFRASSDVDGGYFIDRQTDTMIDRVATTVSVFRGLADVVSIGKAGIKMRVKKSGVSGRWVGEGEAGGESTGSQWAEIEINAEELEAEPWVYNSAVEDADFDVYSDIVNEAGITFGELESAAFISGTGVKQPRGILSYTNVDNASYAWGKVGFIKSGASGAFANTNPADKLIDLLHSLKSQYRKGAVLLSADTTLAEIRKIKDGTGNYYLFNPDPTGNFSGFVLGVPVQIDDNMPVIGADSYSLAYLNPSRAYRIVDRKGIALIRDNITTKGTTKFNFRKRVGGGIKNFEAIKLMKFSA